MVNKKIWKRVTAFVMACALVIGTVGTNTALAVGNGENIAVVSLLENTKKDSITKNTEEKTPELNKLLEEYEKVMPDQSVSSISMAESTCRAIMSNGDLYCWGHNENGQVGNGTTEDQRTPVKVLSDVKSASISSGTVSAITENGDLYCWGHNENGQVGNGTTEDQRTPVKVLSDVKSASISSGTVSAITENGDLYCWGCNANGQVGNGTTEDQPKPVKVLSDVKSVSYSVNGR